MADPKVVKEWLNKADEDLNFAKINLKEENNFYAQICFHFQQAAEKYLKSFIVAYDLEFEKMHNLINLLKVCSKKEPSLLSLMDKCEALNTAYVDTRYPVHWPTDYSREKALRLQKAAEDIAQTIKGLLQK
ncbi:MAG: HEPN domain-containing protein [Deltaproteobacteria bacterium]|nr:HEPN domain-containing protein [Deltaproteobacteria bacterium]